MSKSPDPIGAAIQGAPLSTDAEIADLVRDWMQVLHGIQVFEPYDPIIALQTATHITLELIARLSPPGYPGPCRPFRELLGALLEVRGGNTPRMFRPVEPSSQKHPDPPKLVTGKAVAAAVVTSLIKEGRSLDRAARWVAHHLQQGGAPFARSKNRVRTVKLWRERANDENSRQPLCEAYREMLRMIENRRLGAPNRQPEDVLRQILDDGLAQGLYGAIRD